ncbi:hypothetical protein HDU79_001594 [Rhizoclosmatium sp. JEL0117]|nr:hypothetical protein HDU99_005131 [Rhizoclosmatium hyalinum]KAJ3292255.1 hypothetical protein HDU79_001594 [Rhizoclosmatium sp. JEL0117]
MKRPAIDTFAFVSALTSTSSVTRGQAVALANAVQTMLQNSRANLDSRILRKSDVENAAYFAQKMSHGLRNELDVLRRNESSLMRTDIDSISRSLDSLTQKTSDKTTTLKADVSMDLNNHKAERRALATRIDLRIQEIHHKLTVELSGIKTRLESLKMEATQRAIWVAAIAFGAVLISSEATLLQK